MNLKKIFEMQKALDEKIIREKGLEGQDLLPQKILALQVELGECANEWRGFKFWSKDQEANTWLLRRKSPLENLEHYNPLLEEYVDCLHFILSIGLDGEQQLTGMPEEKFNETKPLGLFGECFYNLAMLDSEYSNDQYFSRSQYETLFAAFLYLGESMGFTWEQIESAYKQKHAINIERQMNGY